MSLDKAIEHGKVHRQPYRKSRAMDTSCRNHGDCPWCQRNRHHSTKRRMPVGDDDPYIRDGEGGGSCLEGS